MSSAQNPILKTRLLRLECHFTWALRKEDTDLTDLLNRLEDQIELDLGKKAGVARTYNCLGYVKFLLGFNTEALSYLENSVKLTRESQIPEWEKLLVVTYGTLAWLHYLMGTYDECTCYLNKLQDITEKYPTTSPSVPYAEVLGEKGWAFLKFSRKYYDRAVECFKQALELAPEEGEWNTGLAIALYRTETGLTSLTESPTIKQLRSALEKNPDDDVIKVLLGLKLADYKEYSEAETLIETALERSPEHPHVMRYVAKFFRMKGSIKRSIALLKRALEREAHSAFIHHQLGLCYKRQIVDLCQLGRHNSLEIQQARNQCIYHLEMATTEKTSFIMAMAELALQYGSNNDISRAEEMFQTTFQTAEIKKDGLQLVHLRYAEFQLYKRKCEPLAIKHFSKCLEMNPNSQEGERGAHGLKKIASRRITKNSTDGEAYGILGFIHKKQGDRQRAIENYEKALSFLDNEDYLSELCELKLSLE